MNGDALRKRLKHITSQTHQKDQAMLFWATAAGIALPINFRSKQNTDW